MRRFVITAGALAALTLAPPTIARADTRGEGQGATITFRDQTLTSTAGEALGGSTQGPTELTPVQQAYLFCTQGGAVTRPDLVIALCAQFMTPAANAPAPPAPTAADIAMSWTQSSTLPNPRLRVQPGYAVAGLTAYLEINTPSPLTLAIPDPVRHDTISISCGHTVFDVNWGDGSPIQQTSSTGGPYPNGDVNHMYQQAAPSYTIAVTEHWTCRWSDPLGNGGTLTGLRSAGQLPIEVREIQSTN